MDLPAVLQRKPSKVSVELLAPDHYRILVQAIRNVLSTELAELTMAQLVDGLPLAASGWEARGSLIIGDHPLTEHESFCDGVIDQTKAFRDAFDPTMLRFDSPTMQSYQNTEVGSQQFKLRLIELVAVSIHQIAVLLFQLEPKLHAGDIDAVVLWKEEPRWITLEGGRRIYEECLFEPRPTLFFHVDYMDYEQYPDGLADMAGYWAEDRIFGGVVLFDRGDSGYECKDVYFHSGRKRTTFRVWKLLDTQFDALSDFLLSPESSPSSPFPILASDDNVHRHDPWDAIALHHIFRDPWERKVTRTKPADTRDVRSTGDYPELAAMFTALNNAYQDHTGHDSHNTSPPQQILALSPELPSRMVERQENEQERGAHTEEDDTSAGAEGRSFLTILRARSRSPVHTADVASLHVKTPPESPVLAPISHGTDLAAEPAETEKILERANPATSQEPGLISAEELPDSPHLLTGNKEPEEKDR